MINVLESNSIDAIVVNHPPVATPTLHDCGVFAELLPRYPIAWLLDHSPDLIADDLEVKALRIGGLS